MSGKISFLLKCFVIVSFFLITCNTAFAWRTSYVYFEATAPDGKACSKFTVGTTRHDARTTNGRAQTTEKVGDCIQYKIVGCDGYYESSQCYRVKDAWSQTIKVKLIKWR
jgi:hypothetical protein